MSEISIRMTASEGVVLTVLTDLKNEKIDAAGVQVLIYARPSPCPTLARMNKRAQDYAGGHASD